MKVIGSQPILPKALEPSPELLELQSLMPISPDDRYNLEKDIIESGTVRDALKVYHDRKTGKNMILCGLNRWQIARDRGLTVNIEVYEGTREEFRELVINDNLNRRHFTTRQKQALIDYFLKRNPRQSNNLIAQKTRTTDKTVKARRVKLESNSEIPKFEKTIGKDGKARKKPEPKRAMSVDEKFYRRLKNDMEKALRECKTYKSLRGAVKRLAETYK